MRHGRPDCPKKTFLTSGPILRAMASPAQVEGEKCPHPSLAQSADELKKDGVELIEATPWLQPLMPAMDLNWAPNYLRNNAPMPPSDIVSPRKVSRLEIGQTVVVKNGTVLAVEGFEGTDKCLAPGGETGGQGTAGPWRSRWQRKSMICSFRHSPASARKTLETCAAVKISVLALEPGKTLVLEQGRLCTICPEAQNCRSSTVS